MMTLHRPQATPRMCDRLPTDAAAAGRGVLPQRHAASPSDGPAFQQLRHSTKNALQRLIMQVTMHPGLRDSQAGQELSADLERRIRLTAALSDVLFGLTRAPDPLKERLTALCHGLIALLGDTDQVIGLDVSVRGNCPAWLEDTVVRVSHELVGNAVKHGMHVFLMGHIRVHVETAKGRTIVTVTDDGWGCAEDPTPGQGLKLARLLAAQHGGSVSLGRNGGLTVASLDLPHGTNPVS